jgi:hypothetical protein
VSLAGLTLPYGHTLDQQNLYVNNSGVATATPVPLTQSPDKAISVTANKVVLQPGATVDISGGGDLLASEWIAGTGGSRDVLSQFNTSFVGGVATSVPLYSDGRPVYAVLPGFTGTAPFDPQFGNAPLVGQSVHLSGFAGLPEGDYVLLPAAYALVPGAYRLVQDTRPAALDLSGFTTDQAADGTLRVAGYLRDALSGARYAPGVFELQDRATWGQYSQYEVTSLND